MYTFNSNITEIAPLNGDWTETDIKNEPMFFRSDYKFARKHGGPLTKAFLNVFKHHFPTMVDQLSIDSRSHMLMKDWAPCITGWHLDDVPRDRADGQPEHGNPRYQSRHVMCLVNAHVAPTEFAIGQINLPDIQPGEKFYKKWHPLIENSIAKKKLARVNVKDKMLTLFNWNSFHQGVPAVEKGWRWFIRASFNTDIQIANEIRQQVQVYLPSREEGW